MPLAQQHLDDNNSLRILVYGPAKSKKTWWAACAAEAGFRVLLFDFEDGSGILNQISKEARERIYILPLQDNGVDSYAIKSAVAIFKKYDFYVNEATRRVTQTPQIGSCHIDMRTFGRDTVVICDSYTALVESAWQEFAITHNIDLSNAEKDEWSGYGWTGRLLNWLLNQMEHFPCPLIVIGHETQNVIKKKVLGGQAAQKAAPIEMVRRQVYSSSNPHGMGICKHFTDVIYMYAEGRSFKIDTRGNKQEDGGCRHIEPALFDWNVLNFEMMAKAANLPKPTDVAPWNFQIVKDQLALKKNEVKPVITGGVTKEASIGDKIKVVSAPKGSGLTFSL